MKTKFFAFLQACLRAIAWLLTIVGIPAYPFAMGLVLLAILNLFRSDGFIGILSLGVFFFLTVAVIIGSVVSKTQKGAGLGVALFAIACQWVMVKVMFGMLLIALPEMLTNALVLLMWLGVFVCQMALWMLIRHFMAIWTFVNNFFANLFRRRTPAHHRIAP